MLEQGIRELMEPDPQSRSQDEEGRRLVLIDPARNWGWRVVNIQKYRRKVSDANQIADGRNAAKVARHKDRKRTPQDTAGHHETPRTPNSDSYTNSNKIQNQRASKTLRETVTEKIPQFSALVEKLQS
jgi:hypothetical protein